MFESYAYGFAVSFVDDVATPVDEESPDVILAEKVRDAVAEVPLADRAEVEEGGIFEGNMCVVENLNSFDKIGCKADSVFWCERILGVVAEIGEGISHERRDFPVGCAVKLEIRPEHGDEVLRNVDIAGLLFFCEARDERCRAEARETLFESLRSREDFANKRMKMGRWYIVPHGYFPMRPEGIVTKGMKGCFFDVSHRHCLALSLIDRNFLQ